ncbi:hypothetical protein ACIBSV_12265 [Embleya sp. NPDC050154]|uniref:hypothetical protein n=1 Tax=Embleya sp. NPDC050154 TaxID=3363988 RepID=UPI00379D85DD
MNGLEHYREAERLLAESWTILRENDNSCPEADRMIAAAQAHATLALASVSARTTVTPAATSAPAPVKAASTTSKTWAVDKLVLVLMQAADRSSRSCWVIHHDRSSALLAPAADGKLDFLAGFRRSTIAAAVQVGRVVVGERAALPPYRSTSDRWPAGTYTHGRMIALRSGAAT